MLDLLRGHGYIVEFETCLDQCHRCESYAFALACGRMVFAPNPEELVAKLT